MINPNNIKYFIEETTYGFLKKNESFVKPDFEFCRSPKENFVIVDIDLTEEFIIFKADYKRNYKKNKPTLHLWIKGIFYRFDTEPESFPIEGYLQCTIKLFKKIQELLRFTYETVSKIKLLIFAKKHWYSIAVISSDKKLELLKGFSDDEIILKYFADEFVHYLKSKKHRQKYNKKGKLSDTLTDINKFGKLN